MKHRKEALMTESTEPTALSNSPSMDIPDEHPPVVEAMEALLFNSYLTTEQKVLLMIMVWKGKSMTKDDLGEAAGMTPRSVEYAMRLLVRIKAVEETEGPDPRVKKWVRFYTFKTENAVPDGPLAELERPTDE